MLKCTFYSQVVLQGFKELIERCYSEKTLDFEHKRNAQKLQFIRQGKLSGILASTPEIVATIEERIGKSYFCSNLIHSKWESPKSQLIFTCPAKPGACLVIGFPPGVPRSFSNF